MTDCGKCHAPIREEISLGGRILALDPAPVEGGNVVLVERLGRLGAKVITGEEMPYQGSENTYRRHKCPVAEKPPRGRSCRRCTLPMPHDVDWDEHPCCDPAYLRELARQGLTKAK